jgi:nicotinamidase-related amidase
MYPNTAKRPAPGSRHPRTAAYSSALAVESESAASAHPAATHAEGERMPANNTGMIHRTGLVLVVIDVQEKLAAAMERRDQVAGACARLMRVAGVLGAPVIITRQYPDGLGDSVAEVTSAASDITAETSVATVDKTAFCACNEPDFLEALYETGRSQAVLAGMETHICVTQTALALSSRGYPVFVAADACCSRRVADHDVSLDRLRAAGVYVTTSESVIYEAVSRSASDEFKRVLAIVKAD